MRSARARFPSNADYRTMVKPRFYEIHTETTLKAGRLGADKIGTVSLM